MDTTLDRPRMILGLILLALGGLFLLNNLGILRGLRVWEVLWGLFWLWLGSVVIGPRGEDPRKAGSAGRKALGLFLLAIGVVTLANGLGIIPFSAGFLLGRFWPLILIAIGVMILLESNRRATSTTGPSAPDRIIHDSIFGDFKLTQPGWQLHDLEVNTVIGDMKIDLARAHIPDGETRLDLRAVIGDIDIWTPPDLPVALEVQCAFVTVNHFGRKQDVILRRFEETPPAFETAPRRVRVRANLVFGDISLTRAG
jgi:lia operon protein LiaF